MKKLVLLGFTIITAVACNMDFYRSDVMTSNMLAENPGAAVYTTDGIYSLFKDSEEYRGKTIDGCEYVRHYFQMTEFRGDNVCLSGETSDPLCQEIRLNDFGSQKNIYYTWWCAYKIIYAANSNIEALEKVSEPSTMESQMLGENYFFRALGHFQLMTIFAPQYSLGTDNLGVVIRTSTDCSDTKRSKVGEVYEQIVADFKKAAELMKDDANCRGDHGFVSFNAARGMLTRVYLTMGKYQECLDLCNEMLGTNPAANLNPDLSDLYVNARTSKETLWCIAHTMTDNQQRGSIGSMYFSTNGTGGTGWGEMYWADPLIELFLRYPGDKRFDAHFTQYGKLNDGKKMIHWPLKGDNDFRDNATVFDLTPDGAGNYTFSYQGANYTATLKSKPEVNNGYPQYFINFGGQETQVFVRDNTDKVSGIRFTFPQYYMSKYSWQDNEPMLSSPIVIRWGEIVLNRAEAEAKLGKTEDAIKDVNVIRHRAGIHEWANFAECQTHNYSEVLDVVLDERRMELCFEGQRAYDLIRNNKPIDRRFAGIQPWEVVQPNDNRLPYQLPDDEILVSGIEQNPR